MQITQADNLMNITRTDKLILFKIGSIAAWIAALVFRRNLDAEASLFQMAASAPPVPFPLSIESWFSLLQTQPIMGLLYLSFFDLVNFLLLAVFFGCLVFLFANENRRVAFLAGALTFSGVIFALATNRALTLLSMSRDYTLVNPQTKIELAIAGEKFLRIHQLNSFHGDGLYPSFFLVIAAGLILSILMLRNRIFGRWTAFCGLAANGIALLYFPVLAFRRELVFLPVSISAVFLFIWYLLIGIRLWRISPGMLEQS